jgi:hypothetical protein
MIGAEACQKGGSMRSKSVAERPKSDDKPALCIPAVRALATSGALSLVRGTETRTASAMKPGLY